MNGCPLPSETPLFRGVYPTAGRLVDTGSHGNFNRSARNYHTSS